MVLGTNLSSKACVGVRNYTYNSPCDISIA